MRNSAVLQFLDPVLKRGYERGGLALRLRHFETALEDLEDETDFLLVQHLSRALPAGCSRTSAKGAVEAFAFRKGSCLNRPQSKVAGIYDHVWYWRSRLPDRKGSPCRVVARSRRLGSVLVEFEDGCRVVTSRYAVRLG